MDKKEEIYFVHGFYYGNENDYLRRIDQDITFQDRVSDTERIKPDHIILIKDSIDDESAVQSLDVNIRNIVGGKSKSILSTKQYFFFDFSAELLSSLINSSSLIIWILYSFYR